MGKILKKLALLFVPVALYFAFFLYFEPNNYFGLKESAAGTAPIGRVKAFAQDPHTHLILGDSRLAHFDMDEVAEWGGEGWQNLAFGGASLRETLDLLEYCLETQPDTSQILLEVSFYTLNAKYDTDRMSALQDTLDNPLAYLFNLEYNVNAFTSFRNWLIWQGQVRRGETTDTWAQAQQETETADWPEEDYILEDGTRSPLHKKLREYVQIIDPVITGWSVNEKQLARLRDAMEECSRRGIRLTLVLPPMHESVTELCRQKGIEEGMAPVLEELYALADQLDGVEVLDYEWGGIPLELEEWQYFDGFHLDTEKGLPLFTQDLFSLLA